MVQSATQIPVGKNQLSADPKAQNAGKSALSRMIEKNQDSQYNIFMKMFLAQVKHQSVDNPMSTHEMTQSVMSFMQAAEHTQTNKLLKQGNDLKLKEQISLARGYENKDVDYHGDVIGYEGTSQKIQFQIPTNLEKVTLEIIDVANEKIIKSVALGVKPGKMDFKWDGEMDGGDLKAQPGQYIVRVTGIDKAQQTIPMETTLQGRVRGITFDEDENEHFLVINNDVVINMNDVISERKIESTNFATLNERLDAQIRQYEELNKLLRKKFEIEAPSAEGVVLTAPQGGSIQNSIPLIQSESGKSSISEIQELGNWIP